MSDAENKKFLIIDSRPFGLFSIFLHTIDNIYWAEQNGYIPVVRWGPGRWNVNAGRPGIDGQITTKVNKGHPKGGPIESTNFFNPDEHTLFEGFAPAGFAENGNMTGIKRCLYQNKEGDNPWEYYFNPLNEYTVEQALQSEHLISDTWQYGGCEQHQRIAVPTTTGEVFNFPDIRKAFLIDSLSSYGRIILRDVIRLSTDFNNENQKQIRKAQVIYHRYKVHDIIQRITVKKDIKKKIESFKDEYFNNKGKTLGVHIRGTDKRFERDDEENFSLRHYIRFIEKYLQEDKTNCIAKWGKENIKGHTAKIFLATDSEEVVQIIKKIFGNRAITYPSIRMSEYDSDTPIPLSKLTGRQHGEEALIETILLSQCDALIGSDSNMSLSAAYMNPELQFILIDTLDQRAYFPNKGTIIL